MKVWILMDDEPYGGYFAGQDWEPNLAWERRTIREVRIVDMPKKIWDFIIEGGAPLDDNQSNDSTWIEWWKDGTTTWQRS